MLTQVTQVKQTFYKRIKVIMFFSQVNTPEPRRLSLPGRFTSLPDLSIQTPTMLTGNSPPTVQKQSSPVQNTQEISLTEETEELSSTCSTPTLMEIKNIRKVHKNNNFNV